jgi:hypothetical protein
VVLRESVRGKALEKIEILLLVSFCMTAGVCIEASMSRRSGMLWLLSVKAAMQLQV